MKSKSLVCLTLVTLVASLALPTPAQTFQVLHTFTGGSGGASPYAGVTIRGGTLYGTTQAGGTHGSGVVYQLAQANSQWTFTVLYQFTGGVDGSQPYAGISIGPNGALYGTTFQGGLGNGTVFELTPPLTICKTAACSWKETVLHAFQGPDGGFPKYGNLIFDQAGNIYGTASKGGTYGGGVAFRLEQPGGQLDVLHSFGSGNDASDLEYGLVFDSAGNLYGTSVEGGTVEQPYCPNGCGTAYALMPLNGGWAENVIYNFSFIGGNPFPQSTLLLDGSHNLYGTTQSGECCGGEVFENFSSLYTFFPACSPTSGVTMDAVGTLYGVCYQDGHGGSVYQLTNTVNGWILTDLYDFQGGSDGCMPFGPVTLDSSGNLYGTALGCGAGYGVVWEIKP